MILGLNGLRGFENRRQYLWLWLIGEIGKNGIRVHGHPQSPTVSISISRQIVEFCTFLKVSFLVRSAFCVYVLNLSCFCLFVCHYISNTNKLSILTCAVWFISSYSTVTVFDIVQSLNIIIDMAQLPRHYSRWRLEYINFENFFWICSTICYRFKTWYT